jgi:sn-glycerol 3-phosphate transport system substrate-binding protein
MNLHRTIRVGVATAMASSSLVALSFLGSSTASAAPRAVQPHTTSCAASNLPKSGTVNITFWEEMSAENEILIQQLVKEFNASQSKVHVTDVNVAGGYPDAWQDYLNDIGTSDEPNVLMLDQYITQGAVDSKSIVPVATCVASTKYKTSDFAKKTIAEETAGGKLQGLPFSVSAPILIYNQNSFAAAKIKSPPTTVAQMIADAKAMKGTKVIYKIKGVTQKPLPNTDGMSLTIDPWYLQVFQGVGDQDFVNNNNGRTGRATAAAFNDSIGLQTFTDLQNAVKDGYATTNPDTGAQTTEYANLYEIGGGESGMTIDSSATLGTILTKVGIFPNVKLGVAELPKLTGVSGGVEPGGNALFLPSYPNSSAAKLAASWEFMQYLDSPTVMGAWDAGIGKVTDPVCKAGPTPSCQIPGSGYVPITTAAAASPQVKAFWKFYPELKSAYTEIMTGKVDDATSGPLLGEYYTVLNDLTSYETDLLSPPYPSPQSELSAAATQATNDIKAYNASL